MAEHQRTRLLGAMVEAAVRHGYAGVTLQELVGSAGVSKSTFYEHFSSKEECFQAAFDQIVGESAREVVVAYREGTDLRDGLARALLAQAQLIAERPEHATFVLVESLGLGTAGAPRRERGIEFFEAMISRALEEDGEGEMSPLEIRGTLGGGRRIIYRRLREGHPERFVGQAEEILDWALGYRQPHTRGRGSGSKVSEQAFLEDASDEEGGRPPWSDPPSSPESRAKLSQRERIMRAVAQLAGERGYAKLSVPAISGGAGVSNQTFYREFTGKQEAFLSAFEALAEVVGEHAKAAFAKQPEWVTGLEHALGAVLTFIARNPVLARFAFFELAAAGPAGRDASELATQRAMAFLDPEFLPSGATPLSEVVIEAIGGGIWMIVQGEIIHGRVEPLPQLVPELLDFILKPLKLSGP